MQAFSNIRVLDLTHVIAGPFCTYQLAVMGADVIKVEPPHNPDISRVSGPISAAGEAGMGSDFTAQNANKRAVCIDLKTAPGREILARLIASADVFVENYRSGALADLGLDYPAVRASRPDIIYCSITGFGQHGPNAGRTAYDNVIQAYSGLMAATGDARTAPLKVGPPVLDYGTGAQAAFAIAAALYQRTATGEGQYIDVAMLDAALMLMSSHITRFQQSGQLPPPSGNNSDVNAGYCCYATAQGLLMLGAYSGAQVKNMWAVLGDPAHGAALDALPLAAMADHLERDVARIAGILLGKSAAEWEIEFNRKRVPAAQVRRLDEALADRQLHSRAVLQSAPDDPESGSDSGSYSDSAARKLPVAAFKYAENGPALTRPPPVLAQHTGEVLREIGVGDDELKGLAEQGVIKMAGLEF